MLVDEMPCGNGEGHGMPLPAGRLLMFFALACIPVPEKRRYFLNSPSASPVCMPIETICEGGFGGSAIVYIQRRNEFEGLGGLITTRRAVTAAYRHDHGGLTLEEVAAHSPSPEPTHGSPRSVGSTTMFLRHAIAKKLDDYFFRIGRYHHAHVPRPLGSTDE